MSLTFPELVLGPDMDVLVRSSLVELHAVASAKNEELEEERRCRTPRGLRGDRKEKRYESVADRRNE